MAASSVADVSPPPTVRVVVFSKDRAFQLGEYLRTLDRYVVGAALETVVLFAATAPFAASYRELAARFPDVRFVDETRFADHMVGGVSIAARSSRCVALSMAWSAEDQMTRKLMSSTHTIARGTVHFAANHSRACAHSSVMPGQWSGCMQCTI